MLRALALAAALSACAHHVPVATAADPELCIHDGAAPAQLVAPHGDRIGVCFAVGDCLVVDHVRGRVVERARWPHVEQAFPESLRPPRSVERFDLERTETTTSVCERTSGCRTLTLPVADQRTLLPAISADGSQLSFVAREGGKAFLDTYAIEPQRRRLGRVPLPIFGSTEHSSSVFRVGTAILVDDSVSLGLNDDRAARLLVDPLTGAQRALLTGSARQLDEHTALAITGRRAAIVNTRNLVVLATHVEPGIADGETSAIGVNGPIAAVAFANPPTLVVIENRRFTRTWRLPVCR